MMDDVPAINLNYLRVLYVNALNLNDVDEKLEFTQSYIERTQPDLIAFVETGLTHHTSDETVKTKLTIPDYTLFRADRIDRTKTPWYLPPPWRRGHVRHGGGLLVAVKPRTNLKFAREASYRDNFLGITFSSKEAGNFRLGLVHRRGEAYRDESRKAFIAQDSALLDEIRHFVMLQNDEDNGKFRTVLVGEFNFRILVERTVIGNGGGGNLAGIAGSDGGDLSNSIIYRVIKDITTYVNISSQMIFSASQRGLFEFLNASGYDRLREYEADVNDVAHQIVFCKPRDFVNRDNKMEGIVGDYCKVGDGLTKKNELFAHDGVLMFKLKLFTG